MKVFIDVDELYPFFDIHRINQCANELGAVGIEVSLETVQHIERVMKEFWEVQKMLYDLNNDETEYVL